MEYMYELKIPHERIAVLIGTKGDVKASIEAATRTRIDVDSKEGDVFIKGEDSVGLFMTREIVKAIARGFNPDVAMRLLKQDYCFDMIELVDFVPKEHFGRVKGRIIGSDGKARKTIEALTDTSICVYGKTVGIIGLGENVSIARRAIEKLLEGAMHAPVYRWLEKNRRELKKREYENL